MPGAISPELITPEEEAALGPRRKGRAKAAVVAAIFLGGAAMLAITALTYRGAPTQGTPGQIDNARGVTPKYPPVIVPVVEQPPATEARAATQSEAR